MAFGEPRIPVILIVEDDPTIRETLGEILTSEGYRVLGVGDGAAALRRLREGLKPALILLDLMMPVMNGWEFLSAQHHDPALAAIPVIVVTGALPHSEQASLEVAGLVTKPVDVSLLLDTIAQVCG